MKRDSGFRRADRVASEIHEILALILSRFSKDPRLSRATITRVLLSSDIRKATVFFRVFPGEDPTLFQGAFDRHRGTLRKELASRLRIKYIPELLFIEDEEENAFDRIERLLEGTDSEDEEP